MRYVDASRFMIKSKWITLLIGIVILSACQRETLVERQGGFLLSLAEITTNVEMKAVPNDLKSQIDLEKFTLKIIPQSENITFSYEGVFQEYIAAPIGTYSIQVTSGENPLLAVDHPYYTGESFGSITALQSTSVTIECNVANALSTIVIPEEEQTKLDVLFSSYTIQATVGTTTIALEDFNQSFYYQASFIPTFTFVGTFKDGNSFSQILTDEKLNKVENFTAGKHCVITLNVTDPTQGVNLININKIEVTETSLSETIPVNWLPAPKVTSETAVATTWIETETTNLPNGNTYTVTAASAIDDIIFDVSGFESPDYVNLGEGNWVYPWSTMSEVIESVGIVVTFSEDRKSATIELDNFLRNLHADNDGTENVLKITVKANDRETVIITPTYTINPPEFTVSCLPGNVWTKEFTVNELAESEVISGTHATLKTGMTYEYSTDGNSWTSFDGTSNLHTGAGKLTPNTTYKVRGRYAYVTGEEIEVKTYGAYQIPNNTFDEGYTSIEPKSNNLLYTFDGGWIDTRNSLTCHSEGVNAFYVSKSSTLPMTENGSTVAHMMTIGWGRGNTCAFGRKERSVIYNISAGIVCVGNYDISTHIISPKAAFIRPSSMSFTYKASPYNNDQYVIQVQLLNIDNSGDEVIIGSGEKRSSFSQQTYKVENINISYDTAYEDLWISHIRILFKCGIMEDRDHLKDEFEDASLLEGYTKAYIKGSEFWLDSFILNYDK